MKKLWVSSISRYSAKGLFPVSTRIPCTGWSVSTGSTVWHHQLYFTGTPQNWYDTDSLLGYNSKTYILHVSNTELPLEKITSSFNAKIMAAQPKSPLLHFSVYRHVFVLMCYSLMPNTVLMYFKSISFLPHL